MSFAILYTFFSGISGGKSLHLVILSVIALLPLARLFFFFYSLTITLQVLVHGWD